MKGMNVRKCSPRFANQDGIGLIEVMVAVLILAVGMLGIAALQSITLKNSGGAAERTQAVIETYAMMDMLRANRTTFTSFNTGGWSCKADGDPANQDNDNLEGWLEQLQANVSPTACGSVNCLASGVCTVGVQWDDSRATGVQWNGDGSVQSKKQSFVTSTHL